MSRHPYYILEDILKHARHFQGSEKSLFVRPPGSSTFFEPLFQIEKRLASHAHWLNHFLLEYKIRLSELPTNPFPIAIRRVLDRIPVMVETRLQNWGWAYALTPDGLHEINERIRAHTESLYYPVLDAALSWRLGRDAAEHDAADELAGEAEKLDIQPTMTPEEGERLIWDRHRTWLITPALAGTIPSVSPEDRAQLREEVDELERQFRRLESPEKIKEYAESLNREVRQTPYELPHLGHRPESNSKDLSQDVATARVVEPPRQQADGPADGTQGSRIGPPSVSASGQPTSMTIPSSFPSTEGVDGNQIALYSCFISHSSKDHAFAQRLHSRLHDEKLCVWFAPHDMRGGRTSREQIEQAIHVHDKLLLVLSKASMGSSWVEHEIRRALQKAKDEKRQVLFPIRICSMKLVKEWQCFDSDSGRDLAQTVRKYHIPDFSKWKEHDAFEAAFKRLLGDLKAEEPTTPDKPQGQ